MRFSILMIFSFFILATDSYFTFSPPEDFPHSIEVHAVTTNYSDFDTIRTDLNQYIWPTNASDRITSCFAEYRSTHFHGGIDIGTNGQTGYNVFAVQKGYVYRIRIQANGYGKMLFVKHPDGYVSTYAHLQKFNPAITAVVRQEQYRRGTYAVDLMPDSTRLPVTKGEVIAYTGDTGFGPPHLHFELRDENLNPVNPSLSRNFAITDNIPPMVSRITVIPLSYNSTIESGNSQKYFSRFPRVHGMLTIPQVLRFHGLIGFGIDADDKSDGSWSRTGIHRLELFVDDSLTFSSELNRVPAEETKEILLHYDLPSILEGKGRFEKLYLEKGNSLPFYDHRPEGSGIINTEQMREGRHDFKIVCYDFEGNNTTLTGSFIANHHPELRILKFSENEIDVTGTHLESIDKVYLYGKRAYQTTWTLHTLSSNRFNLGNGEISLPVNTKPYDVVKLIAETKWGSLSIPMFFFLKKPISSPHAVQLNVQIHDEYISCTATTGGVFTEPPVLTITEGTVRQTTELTPIDVNKYSGSFIPSSSFFGTRLLELTAEVDGRPTTTRDEINVYPIAPNKSGSFSVDNENLLISFDSGAVYKQLCLQLSTNNSKQSTIYSFGPTDIPLDRGIHVSVALPEIAVENHQGLYYRGRSGWIFQTSTIDSGRNTLSTTLKTTLGDIALFRDNTPPNIGRLRTSLHDRNISISFRYFDNLSGVDTDEIKLYIDNTLVIPEIDGEHHSVAYSSELPLEHGKHQIKILAKDRSKNETSLTRIVQVR
jgi:hypothetical protein